MRFSTVVKIVIRAEKIIKALFLDWNIVNERN